VSDAVAGMADRLAAVRERIAAAARRAGRDPASVTLVGVAKRKSADEVVAAVRAGIRHIGENYVQEAVAKIPEVLEKLRVEGLGPPRWHFIGRLQRNKCGPVVARFDCLETVDRPALGDALERRAAAAQRHLAVLLQVNVSGEAQKGGADPEALPALLEAAAAWPHLSVTGLMAIPAAAADPEAARPAFARLRALRDALCQRPDARALHELSMGMSADYEVAIEEGATIIRVGTALFGARDA
jgi:pyridoxal phosphate enzyme (YggS family)